MGPRMRDSSGGSSEIDRVKHAEATHWNVWLFFGAETGHCQLTVFPLLDFIRVSQLCMY